MSSVTPTVSSRVSVFDRAVLLMMASILLVVGVLIWRGDRVGVRVDELLPAADETAVSTLASIRITFDEVMTMDDVEVTLEPAVAGETRWQGRTLVFEPAEALQTGTDYQVTVAAGLQSEQGRELLRPITWEFKTGEPRIAYIGWEEARDGNQIYVVPAAGGTPTRLTDEPINVIDFAVSPDGQLIVYASVRPDGGSDLWGIRSNGGSPQLLLNCEAASCSKPVWAPDGQRLVYERRNFLAPGSPPGPPRLWWLDTATGRTTAVFEDSQWLGLEAKISPDGGWISYYASQSQEIQAYHLVSGESLLIPSRTGEPASWSPDGESLVTTQLQFQSDTFSVYIVKADVAQSELVNLSGEESVNDGWPSWAPDGGLIAFNRKVPRTPEGKQIWVMGPDGSGATNLTNNPDVHYGPPQWAPDAEQLSFQGYSLTKPDDPSIWVLDVAGGEPLRVATPGIRPIWLP